MVAHQCKRTLETALLIGLTLLFITTNFAHAQFVETDLNQQKVVGSDACGTDCHKESIAIWLKSRHFSSFQDFTKWKKTLEITKKLGIKRIRSSDVCVKCHFTMVVTNGTPRPVSGPSCESCHGQGKDWIDIHGDYGGKNVKKEEETPEHKKQRQSRSLELGLTSSKQLFKWARKCYDCHLSHNESLVNIGNHKPGSKFELASWSQAKISSQGESIRHNVMHGKKNPTVSAAKRRVLYVLGAMLEMEYSLRAVGSATEKATFAKSMARRVKEAASILKRIYKITKNPEVFAVMEKLGKYRKKLRVNNSVELNAIADMAAIQAEKLAKERSGEDWAGLDRRIPSEPFY